MAIPTSLRSKRIAARAEATQQLLLFRLQQHWFALPVLATQKVIQVDRLYGGASGTTSLALYQNLEIPVIDINQRIFQPYPTQSTAQQTGEEKTEGAIKNSPSYLVMVQPQQELIGLLLHAPPLLRRIPQSAFSPVPPTYLAEGQIRCVIALIVTAPDEPPIFLLDLAQLIPSQRRLPAE